VGIWQLYDSKNPFYVQCPKPTNDVPQLGQICWVPTIFHNEPWVLNLTRSTSTSHTDLSGTIGRPHSKLFHPKPELPLAHLTLHASEEVIAYRTKKRPAIVIGPTSNQNALKPVDLHKANHKYGYFVIPIYSVSTPDKATDLTPGDLVTARKMQSMTFFPCQSLAGVLDVNGIARLDKLGICHQYNGWIEWTDWALNPELVKTIHSMLRRLFASTSEGNLIELEAILKDVEPE
jgi:hypothetical protein